MPDHEPRRPGVLADHDADLAAVLRTLDRRHALRWLGAGAALALGGCGGGGGSGATASSAGVGTDRGGGSSAGSAGCTVIPEETAGPYPADGSNGNAAGIANALALSGIVRRDIRSSIAGAIGSADGVPLTVALALQDTASGCTPLAGCAVYLWHCTRDGLYSMYSAGAADQNYLRGVQATDADGIATFQTIFPGCYDGRMPHIHLEIYRSLATATSATNRLHTSQLALPVSVCDEVYASSGYADSAAHFARTSFTTDPVFADGVALQLATVSGSLAEGFVATLQVGIAA